MATWMAHLRIAENLLGKIEGLDRCHFAVGNIAPDGGLPDENYENFDPPPEISHFGTHQDRAYPHEDLQFFRQYLSTTNQRQDTQKFSFLLGYFFHLITDNLWRIKVGRPSRATYSDRFESKKEAINELKGDWYGLDLVYVRDHPDCFFWQEFPGCEYSQDYLPFMPAEGIRTTVKRIKDFYSGQSEDVQWAYDRQYKYLASEEMDSFVLHATETLHDIYLLVCIQQVQIEGINSALELCDASGLKILKHEENP
jgi:hypothetical protein